MCKKLTLFFLSNWFWKSHSQAATVAVGPKVNDRHYLHDKFMKIQGKSSQFWGAFSAMYLDILEVVMQSDVLCNNFWTERAVFGLELKENKIDNLKLSGLVAYTVHLVKKRHKRRAYLKKSSVMYLYNLQFF